MTISKYLLLNALVASALYCTPDTFVISGQCESIHRQRYLTLRLKRTMNLLRQMPAHQTRTLLRLDPSLFHHPVIIDTAGMIQKKGSLDPLFDSFKSLESFAHVDDPLFAREFTELVCAIEQQLTQRSTQSETQSVPNRNGFDALFVLDNTTYTEAMAMRYYHAKRIEYSFNMIKKIKGDRSLFFEKDSSNQFVPTNQYTFSHPEIVHCIKEMNKQNSLTPLIWLFGSFEKMSYLSDEQFTKEFLILHMAVLHNMARQGISEGTLRKETLEEVAFIYRANLNQLPIEKILTTINQLGKELPPLIEQYDLNNPDLTWRQLWQKHKWSILGQAALTGINVAMFLFQTNYGSPKRRRSHAQH